MKPADELRVYGDNFVVRYKVNPAETLFFRNAALLDECERDLQMLRDWIAGRAHSDKTAEQMLEATAPTITKLRGQA